jgi:CspA family cold shock protein
MELVNQPTLKLTTPKAKKQSKEKSTIKTGVISWYKKDKGYGFIRRDSNSQAVFLHFKELKKINLKTIESETRVSFEIKEENNKVEACNIQILGISRKKAEQTKKRDIALKVLNVLIAKYPKTFGYKPKPLAIGIGQELFAISEELGLSKIELKTFFSFYCSSREYRANLILNAEKVNLKGEVSGVVTEQQVIKQKVSS